MKIDKLYTLSQFIDECKKDWNYGTPYIYLYNDFLKQQLTKQMFVCDVEEPNNFESWRKEIVLTDDLDSTIWADKCEEYEEAQKKVIFQNCKYEFDAVIIDDELSIPFYDDRNECIVFPTIGDLAEATNGQLKLKNVEI